jgi:adenylate cyclase
LEGRTQSIAAWERLLRADELQNHHIKEDNLQARRLVEEALEIDPSYACAWTELGWTHYADAYFGWTESRENSEDSALEAAEKALELEEDYPNALALLGLVNEIKGDHGRAVELTERAATLAPSHSENTALFARVLTFAGKPDQAIEMFNRAIRLSPIYPAWYLVGLGICYYLENELDSAIDTLQRAIAMEPASSLPRFYLTSAFIEAELIEDAKYVAQEIMRIERNLSVKMLRKGVAQFKDTQTSEKFIENLIKAGLPE